MKGVVVLTRDMARSLGFWQHGLGLSLGAVSDQYCELDNGRLALKQTYSEALLSTAYSPQLHFETATFDATLVRCLEKGATLDGPVKHPSFGKVASLRSPDGVMVGLIEMQQ